MLVLPNHAGFMIVKSYSISARRRFSTWFGRPELPWPYFLLPAPFFGTAGAFLL